MPGGKLRQNRAPGAAIGSLGGQRGESSLTAYLQSKLAFIASSGRKIRLAPHHQATSGVMTAT